MSGRRLSFPMAPPLLPPADHPPPRLLLLVVPDRAPFEEAQAQSGGRVRVRFFPTPLDALAALPSSVEGGPVLVWIDGALVFPAEAGALRLADRAYPRVPLLVAPPEEDPPSLEKLEVLLQGTRTVWAPFPQSGEAVLEEVEARLGPLHPWKEMGSLLEDLVQGVADALNNPLATLSGYLQLLEMQLPPQEDSPARATLAQAREGLARLEQVVRDLEIASGGKKPRREEVDLAILLRRRLDEEDPQEKLFSRGSLPSTLPWKGDPALFLQALEGLLRLSKTLVPSGVPILLQVRPKGDRLLVEFFLPATRPSPRWRVERTFHPFFLNRALQAPEIGLSPAVAAGAARALGGEARARWEKEGGLRLLLDLPLSRPSPPEESPS